MWSSLLDYEPATVPEAAVIACAIVLSLQMGTYWSLWLLFGWLGCGLGWVPSWCPQPLP